MRAKYKKSKRCASAKPVSLEARPVLSCEQKTSFIIPPNFYAIVNMPEECTENSICENRTSESAKCSFQISPRMAVDGTHAPPRMLPVDKSVEHSNKTPHTTPSKYRYPRMSTGGRVPPKSPSPLKKKSPLSSEETPRPSTVMVRAEMQTQGKPRKAVKKLLVESETVKKPLGRPKKVGQPKKHPEVTNKRPKKSLTKSSQVRISKGQGRPKSHPKTPPNSKILTASPPVRVLRYVLKTVTKSAERASGEKAGLKQRGRAGKSVSESSSRKKSRANSSGKTSKTKGSRTGRKS